MTHEASDSTCCYNCGAALHGSFCAACGQQALPLNPSLHTFLHDFTHELLHVDGKIFSSVRRLLFSPGFLTREQFDGRRARWVPPIRLYLIFSVLYFALSAVSPEQGSFKITTRPNQTDDQTTESIRKLGFKDETELREVVSHAQGHWAPRVMFVLVPLFAWLVRIVTRGTGRNYPQHLYFALHVHAAWFAAGAVAALVRLATPELLGQIVGAVLFIYGLAYAAIAFHRVYGYGRLSSGLRISAVLGVYLFAVLMALMAIILPAVFGRTLIGGAAHQ